MKAPDHGTQKGRSDGRTEPGALLQLWTCVAIMEPADSIP
ncbi:hypothetical protein AMC99_02805 [Altererythrobacter epoxidivorans]|uniref:Uncharacterized protein n=1 Tax=Altererythrobacter epoxidivorans TaxID=361183 RepID=A0A0M3TB81_9SPHN|nr:hypothetical protein AMC99_02805 [Altererythrobacter epoxidivorans]